MNAMEQKWQQQVQEASETYNKFQTELNKSMRASQQLTTQLTENASVKEEFALLEPTAKVFKQVGPVLIPQELEEAKGNVQKRLDWIGGEIKRVDETVKSQYENLEKQKEIIMKVQKERMESLTAATKRK